MDYDIEWLFELVYETQKNNPKANLKFISDWNCYTNIDSAFSDIISMSFEQAKKSINKYHYSFEQFELKTIIKENLSTLYDLNISDENFSITSSSTNSISLSIRSIQRMGYKRALLLTPAYFSLTKELQSSPIELIFFHLLTKTDFQININELEKVIKEQMIDCVFVTDPIYSTGMSIPQNIFDDLIQLCNKYNAFLLIDYSLGGLDWNLDSLTLMPAKKLHKLLCSDRYIFIDSLPKRLFVNGIKASIIFGDKVSIDVIDREMESLAGALNSIQVQFLKSIFEIASNKPLIERLRVNIKNIKNNYNLLKNLKSDRFYFKEADTGFFIYAFDNTNTIAEINTKKYATWLLKNKYIVVLTNDRLGHFQSNNFGFRINLSQNFAEIQKSFIECCRLPLHNFNNI